MFFFYLFLDVIFQLFRHFFKLYINTIFEFDGLVILRQVELLKYNNCTFNKSFYNIDTFGRYFHVRGRNKAIENHI